MLISNIYVDDDAQSFKTPRVKNYSFTAPRDHILLGYDNDQSFETPRINKCNVTASRAQIFTGGNDAQLFKNPVKTITVSLHYVSRFCWAVRMHSHLKPPPKTITMSLQQVPRFY